MLKYEAIARDIQSSIEDGSLRPNERLPTVVELCEIYAVSKITVKRAMDWLTEAGLVTTRRGSGSYVKNSTGLVDDPLSVGVNDRAQGFTAEHADPAEKVSSMVYAFDIVIPSPEIARHLAIANDDFTYYHCRTRLVNNVPITIEYTHMPLDLIPGLKRRHVCASVYRYLQQGLGLKIASFHRAIRAVPADQIEAERLGIACNEPLLEFEQVGYLDSGVPFEYSISRNVGKRYTLHNITLA
ncbi:transcriptional regulator, GntR family [Coriobacterium glomerans PW2]|uniref:Transcriptional regulator, GntR family n=1 Tax=Coriobacterium glomerans (strain ATCC 49209 / DSM 20642 / JCM 10262 / PW2) TaxID=700015 RepID=F2N8Y0_CORGP|nr:GntR family transcriptional regulator [Coriobacterium glomerans]AEB07580.1 transcriptional regulator, GntR family [Coriobacterium glomerans PW2]